MFQTPILFVIYKNPEVTKLVFDRIREIQPAFLYISADGSKTSEFKDVQEIEETRRVTENIDWDCQVIRRYSEANLGCKIGVSSAITWFFQHVEMGIILEYDCLPAKSFFPFCENLLIKYKDDIRISSITGNNFDSVNIGKGGIDRFEKSYYYSSLAKIWGWASWRRAWDNFDISLSEFESYSNNQLICKSVENSKIQKYWLYKIWQVFVGINKSTWGFIWVFTHLKNQSICITPSHNLVSNIGFNKTGTHATNPEHVLSNLPFEEISEPFTSPDMVQIDFKRDVYFTNLLIHLEKKEFQLAYFKSKIPKPVVKMFKKFRSLLVDLCVIKNKKGWQR